MSRTMSAPWLRSTLLDLLAEPKDKPKKKKACKRNSRSVQVIRVLEHLKLLVVNDKENSVTVMPTKDCLDDLETKQISLKDLNYSIIQLHKYHFSTAIHSCGFRDENLFQSNKITLPIALQCSKLTMLGANDRDVIGTPRDLNKDPEVRDVLSRMQFIDMSKRLGSEQFPEQSMLPDAGSILIG